MYIYPFLVLSALCGLQLVTVGWLGPVCLAFQGLSPWILHKQWHWVTLEECSWVCKVEEKNNKNIPLRHILTFFVCQNMYSLIYSHWIMHIFFKHAYFFKKKITFFQHICLTEIPFRSRNVDLIDVQFYDIYWAYLTIISHPHWMKYYLIFVFFFFAFALLNDLFFYHMYKVY